MQRALSRSLDKIKSLIVLLETPGAYQARRAGCYLNIYSTLHRLAMMGISPKTIIDIGANRGQYSKTAHYVFPQSMIYAFEPLKECFVELEEMALSRPNIKCYNMALGASTGTAVIHRSEYDYSSSLLEMDKLHKEAFPYTARSTDQEIVTMRLDDVISKEVLGKPILMKIDVQGFEENVVEGAQAVLSNTKWLICELSFKTLYTSQPLFDQMYNRITKIGFTYAGQIGTVIHPVTQENLQADGLFVRN